MTSLVVLLCNKYIMWTEQCINYYVSFEPLQVDQISSILKFTI